MAPNEVAVPQVQIIGRVTSLPVVAAALGAATDRYQRVKGFNQFLGNTLTRAESTLNLLNETAVKPVVLKLEKPITYADTFACKGMDTLEAKVPVVKKAPEEILNEGWEKYEEVKKLSNERATELKNYTYEKMNSALSAPYAVAVRKSMDSAMDLTEQAVNHFLPAVDGESQEEEGHEEHNVVQRMSCLSEKMRRRVSRRGLAQYQAIQKRSEGAIQRLTQSVDLVKAAKDLQETGLQRVSEVSTAVQTKATWLWGELLKEEQQEAGDEPKTIEQRLLSMARVATHEAITQYHRLAGVTQSLPQMLPNSVQSSLEQSTQYAVEFYQQLSSASSLKDVSDMTLKQMSAGLESMQSIVAEIFSGLRRSASSGTQESGDGSSQ
jgi:perilipin-2